MEKMVATVKCPYCRRYLIAEFNDYRTAEAIPESSKLPEDPGRTQVCPNPKCQKQYFIRYKK